MKLDFDTAVWRDRFKYRYQFYGNFERKLKSDKVDCEIENKINVYS